MSPCLAQTLPDRSRHGERALGCLEAKLLAGDVAAQKISLYPNAVNKSKNPFVPS
jgi:hypothetical protein